MEPQSMKYTVHKIRDVLVVELDGEMWGGFDSLQLKETVTQLVEQGERRFIIDLKNTKIVNSAGIGTLIACKVIVREAGGSYHLCSVSDRTRTTMAISEISDQFEIFDDRDQAFMVLGIDPDPTTLA
jgi:anti-anti-sigma factor